MGHISSIVNFHRVKKAETKTRNEATKRNIQKTLKSRKISSGKRIVQMALQWIRAVLCRSGPGSI
jgi:hypothetical protein